MAKDSKNGKGGNSLFAKKLAGMKARWDGAKEASKKGGDFEINLEDGRYICKLTDASLKDGKNDSLGVVFQFTVVDGEGTGENMSRWAGFDTDDRVVYLQRDLRKLGVDVDDFDITDIEKHLAQLVKDAPTVRITLKTNGEYRNVYIDKLIDPDEETAEGEEAEEETEEEDTETEAEEEEEDGEAEDSKEEEEEDAEEEEEVEVEKGDSVTYVLKGKKQTGKVQKIKGDTLHVMNAKTKKVDEVAKDSVEVLAEVEE